jgi:hypothetical protein
LVSLLVRHEPEMVHHVGDPYREPASGIDPVPVFWSGDGEGFPAGSLTCWETGR